MAPYRGERPLVSAASTLGMLGAGVLVIVVGLFIAADALEGGKPVAKTDAPTKVGSTLAVRDSQPVRRTAAPAPPPPSAALPPAAVPVGVGTAPAAQSTGATVQRVSTVYDGAPAAEPAQAPPPVAVAVPVPVSPGGIVASAAPAAPAAEVAVPVKTAKGAAGCTSYKTYDPVTQTFRGFDGKTRECKPAQ